MMPDSLPPAPPARQTALDWALHYMRLGWSVVPVRPPEKLPAVPWARRQTQPADEATIRTWFDSIKGCGVGLVQGAHVGTIVLDFDGEDGAETQARLEARGLPPAPTSLTGSGGAHVILRHPGRYVPTRKKVLPGMDVRGDGGFIVAPPSVHGVLRDSGYVASGRVYAWDVDAHPDEVVVPDCPEWLAEIICGEAPGGAGQSTEIVRNSTAKVQDGREQYMRDTILAVCREMRDGLGRLPTEAELIEAAWPQYASHVDFSRPGRGRAEFDAKVRYTLGRIQAGAVRALVPAAPPSDLPPDVDPETGEVLEEPDIFNLVWFRDIAPALDANDFVQGVLMEGSAAVVYGESNAGKTFWTTDLALHVAAGKRWNDRRVDQGGVVYCVLEGGIGFQNRVTAWRGTHKPSGPVHFAAVKSGVNMLRPNADTQKLIRTIKHAAAKIEMPVKLIVVDTLARAFAGGNENASEDMGALVQNMDEIRRQTGACVLFVHHSGKDQAKGARGHSSLRAAIDTEIEVKASEDSPVKTATSVKQREMPKGEVFHFQLEVVELGKNKHDEPVTTCVVQQPSDEDIAAVEAAEKENLSDDQIAALRVLTNLLAGEGMVSTHPDLPKGVRSVPETWWADRFKQEAKPGASDDTKRKAFSRASAKLLKIGKIGMAQKRVWLV